MKIFVDDAFVQKVVEKYPKPLNELGEFVYYRTYSRWLDDKNRREYWHETCQRAVNYNMNLLYEHLKKNGKEIPFEEMKKEAQEFFVNMYLTKQFLSGRTLWVGGANEIVNKKFVLGNFNCSFLNISKWEDFGDLFYLLMVGTGVGFKCTKEMASNLPKIRVNVKLTHLPYVPVPKNERLEHTHVDYIGNKAIINIGDSKEGWVESLNKFFEILTKEEYEHIEEIIFNYNSVRPKGERLKTFGGTASGHEPLKEMYEGIGKVLRNEIDPYLEPIEVDEKGYGQVRPIHVLDIGNLIGANVVVGGVRRTAEIFLFDADDVESLLAKYGINGFWNEKHFEQHEEVRRHLIKNNIDIPKWFEDMRVKQWGVSYNKGRDIKYFNNEEEANEFSQKVNGFVMYPVREPRKGINHRRMSNNSVAFETKPTRDRLKLQFALLKGEGEPAFVNLEEARRRRPNAEGLNPCVEIILDSYGVCNLTTVNVKAFVYEENGVYKLDFEGLLKAQRMSARAGLRMTLARLELPHWDEVQQRDRLLGTSLTGWKDAMYLLGYTQEQEDELKQMLHKVAREEADKYAFELGVNKPLLVTAVKPEGTLSQVAGGVSSGLHWSHSPYYIRRIRINANDPLVKVAQDLGWNVNPEVGTEGETFEERMKNATTLVIDFPIKSGSKVTKDDISAREQLENYFSFQKNYTEHNTSNTITVKPHEWDEVEQIIWDNWDDFVGVSFLAHDGGTYQLAPYEAITEEQYYEMKSKMKPFDPQLLMKYERDKTLYEAMQEEVDSQTCEGGACTIR
jgi:ribonucleoside-triphosphate reductase (thioredoxin)